MSSRFHLTTVPLNINPHDIPTLQITLFSKITKISKMFSFLVRLDNKALSRDVVKMLKKLIKREFVFMFIKHFMIQQKF